MKVRCLRRTVTWRAWACFSTSPSILEDAVERQLAFGGQPGGQRLAGQLEDTPVRFATPCRWRAGRDQAQFVQDAGPQIARDALHFFDVWPSIWLSFITLPAMPSRPVK